MNIAESLALGYDLSEQQLLETLFGEQAARSLLDSFTSFEALCCASLAELKGLEGIGEKRSVQIKAIVEFSRRIFKKEMNRGAKFTSSYEVFQHYGPMLRGLQQESFFAVLLDNKNRVIKHIEIAKGTINSCAVHVRDILRLALKEGCLSMILLHNHPSGEADPSREDRELTDRVKSACELCGVNVLDHVVVAGNTYVSFADRGLI